MQGPIAATIAAGLAPSRTIAATVASITPATAPRQPAWTAPATPAFGSASRIGAQSAVMMPRAMSRRVVTMASARGPLPGSHGIVTSTTSAPCTCMRPTRRSGSGADRVSGAGAVLQHRITRVATRQAAIEAGVGTAGNAALAREEAMGRVIRGRASVRQVRSRIALGHHRSIICRRERRSPRFARQAGIREAPDTRLAGRHSAASP